MYIRSNWPYDIPNGRFYQQMLVEAHEQCQQVYDKCEGQLFPVDRKVLKEGIATLVVQNRSGANGMTAPYAAGFSFRNK